MDYDETSNSRFTLAGQEHWKTAPLSALINHIVSAHHEYLRVELPRIQEQLEVVYAASQQRAATLASLPGIFFLMKDCLDLHMHGEESTLFPAIVGAERAANGGQVGCRDRDLASRICAIFAEHETAISSLDQIREITRDYMLPAHACDLYRNLFVGIEALESDVRLHMHLENEILFPRAMALQS